jgi:hypothetical protein
MCKNLGLYVDALTTKRYYISILTSKRDWTRFFQGVACENFANDHYGVSLIYANYGTNGQLDSNMGIADFTPFGGWEYPFGKKVAHNVKIPLNCGPTPRNVTVEKFSFPA